MRKLLRVLMLSLLSFVLVACSSAAPVEKVFEKTQDAVVMKLTYFAEGDKVVKQKTENVIDLTKLGVTKEQMEEQLTPMIEKYKTAKGVTYNITYTDTQILENVEIDYTDYKSSDYEAVKELIGMEFSGNTEKINGISMKKSEEALKAAGFTAK